MRYYLTFIITFLSISGFSQPQTGVSETFELPNFVTPSPNSSKIATYGNVSVNENSGKISPSIPLLSFKVGELEVPVSLNYNGEGVKVNDQPTIVGMNWVLNAGGLITRTVKDLPDETNKAHLYYSEEYLNSQLQLIDTELWGPTFILNEPIVNQILTHHNFDSERDVFQFNFNGYSGSFYIEKDSLGNLRTFQSKYHQELKIEIVGDFFQTDFIAAAPVDNYYFVITDTQGTKYYFGNESIGFNYSSTQPSYEETQFSDRRGGEEMRNGQRAKTAFYLTKIVSRSGDLIYLEYHNQPFQIQDYQKNQRICDIINKVDPTGGFALSIADQCSAPNLLSFVESIVSTQTVFTRTFHAKHLKRIWSPQTTANVYFDSTPVYENFQLNTNNLKYRVLNEISYAETTIKLSYDKLVSQISSIKPDYFFLTQIELGNLSSVDQVYQFEYNHPENLPGNFSNAQDFLGFYNGVETNLSLLPKNPWKYLSPDFLSTLPVPFFENFYNVWQFKEFDSMLADREPRFALAISGTLKKITYPTGGYTLFDYEPVELKPMTEDLMLEISRGTNYGAQISASGQIGLLTLEGPYNPLPTQEIDITIEIGADPSEGADYYHHYVFMVKKDLCHPNKPLVIKNVSVPTNLWQPFNQGELRVYRTFKDSIYGGHAYEYKIGFTNQSNVSSEPLEYNSNTFSNLPNLGGRLSFRYYTGMDLNDGAGIRIKRVSDFYVTDSLPIIRKYYYNKFADRFKTPAIGERVFYPLFYDGFRKNFEVFCPTQGTNVWTVDFTTLNSNPIANGLPSTYSPNNYEYVTIGLGENFENGAIQKRFRPSVQNVSRNFNGGNPIPNPLNISQAAYYLLKHLKAMAEGIRTNLWSNEGQVIEESVIRNDGGHFNLVKKTSYQVNDWQHGFLDNLSISKLEDCINCALVTGYDHFIGMYRTYSLKPFTVVKTVTEFLETPSITAYEDTYLFPGWNNQDHDGDGVYNLFDENYPPVSPEEFEQTFMTFTTDMVYSYDKNHSAGMPDKITTSESNGSVREQWFLYPIPSDIDDLTGVNPDQAAAYAHLFAENRISSPIHESTHNGNDVTFQKRTYYKLADYQLTQSTTGQTAVVSEVHGAKGTNPLEPRIYFNDYDDRANPTEVSMPDGVPTVYIWSPQRRPLLKVDNANYSVVLQALQSAGIDTNTSGLNYSQMTGIKNALSAVAPTAQITSFDYIFPESLLYKVMAPNGDITTYIYDEFKRLKHVKDSQGNILEHYEYHYLTQN